MKILDLSKRKVNDAELAQAVKDNPDCTTLILNGCPVTDISCIHTLKLTVLNISRTQVQDISVIDKIPTLTECYASECTFKQLPSLTHATVKIFDVSGTPISDIGPLMSVKTLEDLNLALTKVKVVSPLVSLPKLRKLNLEGSQVTAQSLTELNDLPAIKELIVDNDDSLRDVAQKILKNAKTSPDEKNENTTSSPSFSP